MSTTQVSPKVSLLLAELNIFLNRACFIHGVEKIKQLVSEIEQERSSESDERSESCL